MQKAFLQHVFHVFLIDHITLSDGRKPPDVVLVELFVRQVVMSAHRANKFYFFRFFHVSLVGFEEDRCRFVEVSWSCPYPPRITCLNLH